MWPACRSAASPGEPLVPRPALRTLPVAELPGSQCTGAASSPGDGGGTQHPGDRRDPLRVHPVRGDACRRRAAAPSYAAHRGGRPDRDLAVQDRGGALRGRPGPVGAVAAPGSRMGDYRQPVRAAARLRAAVEALRSEPRSRVAAEIPARRLEGRARAAGDDLRAVVVPRQHRRRADRRHHRARGIPRQGAHRLPRGHRRRLERRRLGQRRRRHHHHDDVDRRRASAAGDRSLHRRRRRDAHLRRPGIAAAAALLAHHARGAGQHRHRLGTSGHRRPDTDRGHRRQHRGQCSLQCDCRAVFPLSVPPYGWCCFSVRPIRAPAWSELPARVQG